MKINTVIFDIGGVMVGLGRMRFFQQFGYPQEICERVMNSTVKSPYWKELAGKNWTEGCSRTRRSLTSL